MDWHEWLDARFGEHVGHAVIGSGIALLVAAAVDVLMHRVVAPLARRTRGDLDDVLVDQLARPLAFTAFLVAEWMAVNEIPMEPPVPWVVQGVFVSVGALYWTFVGLRTGNAVIDVLAREADGKRLVKESTRPLLVLIVRVLTLAMGVYFFLLGWKIDVTAWLASAGIAGVALGFAAQNTLANLIAGISILADAPYKIGDFLVLENGTRGRVTAIGMRSTRMITREDVEIVIPNSQMASTIIINESGGTHEHERVTVAVSVAYGTDVDLARAVLLDCARQCQDVVLDDPSTAPQVRFREFGDSGLLLHLLVWIPRPELRGTVLDRLNTIVYKRLDREGISIPFPTRHVLMQPAPSAVQGDQASADPAP